MFVPRLTPTSAFRLDSVVDLNFAPCEHPLEAPVCVRCLCVLIKRSSTRRCSHCFLVAHTFDLSRQILSTMPRASAAFAVEVKLAEKAGLRRRLVLAHSVCSLMPQLTTPLRPPKRQ
jgi:hypothetical protein